MIIKSFVRDQFSLRPIDVEIVLTPGLPVISVLGLPDKVIQESTKRIQAALLNQGYQMPRARQVIVNLWPRDIRKSSLGLDLAIALGILIESQQKVALDPNMVVYGELDMQGAVRVPQDISMIDQIPMMLLTGASKSSLGVNHFELSELKANPKWVEASHVSQVPQRPSFLYPSLNPLVCELLKIVASGEHSLLLAGSPGTGKTAFVDGVSAFLAPPDDSQMHEIKKNSFYFKQSGEWRPVVKPHHSSTVLAFSGGGNTLVPGELMRAHQGVLILDELLEFSTGVQSLLREPMESGVFHIARAGRRHEFSCQALFLATSNLCPCGEFSPTSQKMCRCSSLQLRRYLQKLSGPFIDRFSIFQFTTHWSKTSQKEFVPSEDVLNSIEQAVNFRKTVRKQNIPNEMMQSFENKFSLPNFKSKRREISCLKIARTLADLDFSEEIKSLHIEKALHYCYFPFEQIKKIF
jgi:magnesium chelatase family protein